MVSRWLRAVGGSQRVLWCIVAVKGYIQITDVVDQGCLRTYIPVVSRANFWCMFSEVPGMDRVDDSMYRILLERSDNVHTRFVSVAVV